MGLKLEIMRVQDIIAEELEGEEVYPDYEDLLQETISYLMKVGDPIKIL